MKRFTLLLLALIFVGTISTESVAQKFGYLNSQQLLAESPAVTTADKSLETYQKQLVEKGKSMVAGFEKEYKAYMEKANAGTLSKVQMQQKEEALGKKQEAIQKYEVEVQQKLMKKREELYKPILDKMQKAIDAIGAEEKYTMIFDTSTGVLLHALDSEDVTAKVKARLGF